MRCSISSLVIYAVVSICSIARADSNYKFDVTLTGATVACQVEPTQKPSTTDTIAIDFVLNGMTLTSASVATADGTDLRATPTGAGSATYLFSGAAGKEFVATVATDLGPATCPKVQAPASKSGDAAPVPDEAAAKWWNDHHATAEEALRSEWKTRIPSNTRFLVHLPSGRPAFPQQGSLREGIPLQVVVLTNHALGPYVDVTSCPDEVRFRIKQPDGAGAAEKKGEVAAEQISLIPVGQIFECGAGAMSYDLKSGPGVDAKVLSTTKLVSRPVYSFALVTAVGFDTTISHDFAAVRSPSGINEVARENDRVGPAVLAGAEWMVGGVDYGDMKWNNYIVNPFAAVDASSALTGFVVGDSITVTGGVSLAIGLAVHRGTRLTGVSVGTPLGDAAAVPKEATWHDPRFGLFLGVTLDSNVYNALKGS
jgi:hypothetical protein